MSLAKKKMNKRYERTGGLLAPTCIAISALFAVILVVGTPVSVSATGIQQPSVVTPDTPFIEAVRDGDIDALKAALVRGESLDARDKLGSPALFVALQFSQHQAFDFLLENGCPNPGER